MRCPLALLAVLAVAARSPAQDIVAGDGIEHEEAFTNPLNVTLVWYDIEGLLPRDIGGMAREVVSVFREIGVEVRWRIGAEGEAPRAPGRLEVPIILLATPSGSAGPGVMGVVLRDHPPPSPVWIFLSSVRKVLGHPAGRSRSPSPRPEPDLDVALGRIVAHEVVHAIAPWRPHTHGLMGRAIDRAGLTGARRPLAPDCAAAVRSGLVTLTRGAQLQPEAGRLVAAH